MIRTAYKRNLIPIKTIAIRNQETAKIIDNNLMFCIDGEWYFGCDLALNILSVRECNTIMHYEDIIDIIFTNLDTFRTSNISYLRTVYNNFEKYLNANDIK